MSGWAAGARWLAGERVSRARIDTREAVVAHRARKPHRLTALRDVTGDTLTDPLAIIYAGSDPSSPIAGFMYYAMTPTEPTGFAGPNDFWHYHTNICLKYGADGAIDAPFGADSDVPADLCTRAGGSLLQQTQWMVHVWSVPGWESQQGLFGEVNPALTCPDGTYYMLPMERWLEHPLNVCLS